jgi:transcriptional regulator with XRE-family HTH domain
MSNVLGEKIHRLRKEKGLTLDGLAEAAGASKSYIWELENKNPPRPSAEKVARIAEALGVTSDFLVDDHEKDPTPDVVDQHFFRQYRRLPNPTKEKLRQMLEILGKDE